MHKTSVMTSVRPSATSPILSRWRTSRASSPASAPSFSQTRLDWNVARPQPGCHAIRSQAALNRLWRSQAGVGEPPVVDFERLMVLAAFAGEGCCRETLTISRIKSGELVTTIYVCAFTQRWTTLNPMHVLLVPRTEQPIQFVRLG